MGDDPSDLVERALTPVLGAGVDVSGLRPLTSGASRQSFRFEAAPADQPDKSRSYVLQQEAVRSALRTGAVSGPLPMTTQATVMTAALKAGVPVAPIVAAGEHDDRQYIIAEWMEGEALPPRMLRDPELAEGRGRLMEDCARALAGIHRIDPEGLGLVEMDRLGTYRAVLDTMGEPRPVLELGYRWLVEHQPAPGPRTVVHGDFRLGNLLVGRTGLQAVLDWEMTHIGDPHEDVAWATIRAWRFDRHREPGIFPEPQRWAEAYAAAAGPDSGFDPAALLWWQIAGTWSWAVISAMQARRHLDGWMQSLEHAVIGRRVCESEWDLLELLP
jgi:aminoglycoside phosphotransferase (APT) family kinase protein